jgi:putative membrane protein
MFLIHLIVTMIAILIISYLFPRVIKVDGFLAALITAFVLGIINAILRPILVILTLPVTILTLGLFLLVINGLLLWLAAAIVPGFRVNGFWGAVLGSILISIVSWALTWFLPR